jgi:hypothetical protein
MAAPCVVLPRAPTPAQCQRSEFHDVTPKKKAATVRAWQPGSPQVVIALPDGDFLLFLLVRTQFWSMIG